MLKMLKNVKQPLPEASNSPRGLGGKLFPSTRDKWLDGKIKKCNLFNANRQIVNFLL